MNCQFASRLLVPVSAWRLVTTATFGENEPGGWASRYGLVEPEKLYKLGYGRYEDVVTSLQFERILSASGPFGGHVRRISDGSAS